MKNYLQPGMVVFDLGAHHGFYTLLAANLVGPTGKVIAFEPSPSERRKLIWHIHLNRCHQVKVEPFALSDREGTMEFYLTRDNSANSLSPPEISPIVGKVIVPVTTLDAYCQSNGIERIDLVKMDVEGAELLVLKGARQVLSKMRPVIIMEVSHRTTARFGYNPQTIRDFLHERGFVLFGIRDEENEIAVPKERIGKVEPLVSSFRR